MQSLRSVQNSINFPKKTVQGATRLYALGKIGCFSQALPEEIDSCVLRIHKYTHASFHSESREDRINIKVRSDCERIQNEILPPDDPASKLRLI